MNLNNLTTKALEAVSASQQEAFNNGNPQLDTLHLLKSMLDVDQDSLPFVLEKAGVNRNILLGKVEEKLKALPKAVNGQVVHWWAAKLLKCQVCIQRVNMTWLVLQWAV